MPTLSSSATSCRGSIDDAKSSEFIVTGVSVTASGTDDEVLVFTGYISDETIRQQGLLNTFSLGAVGNDVRLHFLIAEGATAYIPTWGDADSALGYNSDGELTNMAFPEELPALGTAGQVLVVNTAENDSEWADAPSGLPALGTAGQLLTVNSGQDDAEWADAPSGLPTLGDAGQVLTVDGAGTAAEWADAAASGTVSIVAYSSAMTEVDDWVNGDFENLYTGLVTNDVNHGEFTLTTVSGDQRVVIPEDGLYQVVVTYYLDVDNDSDGNQRYQAIGRIQRDRSGTVIDIGEHGTGYSRGQYNDILSRISVTVLGLAAFETDDEIYGELRAHRQTFGFAADVSGTISIIKVGGAKGDDGAAGAAGTDGAAGADGAGVPALSGATDGQVVTYNSTSDAAEWADATGGSGLPTLGTAGQILAVNSGASAAEWVDPAIFSRPEGRQYALLGRADSLQLVNQVRLQSDADIVYISQDDTDPSVDYRDVLDVGRVWELEQGSDYRVYRTESYTTTNSDFGHTIAFTVEVLDSAGSLAFDNADTVTLTTEQRELPETLGTAGQVLTVDEDGVFVEWADVPDELPTLGNAGQVLTVNSGATDYEWSDLSASGTPRPGGRAYSLTGHTTLNVVGRVGLFAISGTLTLSIVQTPTSPDPDFRDVIGVGDIIEVSKTSSNFRLLRVVSVATDGIIGSYRLLQWAVSYEGGSLNIAVNDSITLTTAILTKAADDGQVIAWDDSADSYVPVDADLSVSRTSTSVTIESSTAGDNATIPEATSANAGVLAAADKVVIDRLPNALGTARQVLQVNNTATGTGWYDGGVYHELSLIRPIGYTYSVNHRSGSSTPWYSGDNQVLHSSTTVIFCQNVTNPFMDYRNFFENDEVFELKRRSQDDRWHVLRVNSSSDTVAGSRRLVTYNVTEIHRASGGHGAPSNTPYELRTNRAVTRDSLSDGDMVAHLGSTSGPGILRAGDDGQVLTMASGIPEWVNGKRYAPPPPGWSEEAFPGKQPSNTETDLEDDVLYGQIMELGPGNARDWQYGIYYKRQTFTNATVNHRTSLYLWSDDNNRWEQQNTRLDTTIIFKGTGLGWSPSHLVRLPSSFEGVNLQGFCLITMQVDTDDRIQIATFQSTAGLTSDPDGHSQRNGGISGTTSYSNLTEGSGTNDLFRDGVYTFHTLRQRV